MSGIKTLISDKSIVPVLAFNSVEEALTTCNILAEEDLTQLEIALRTPVALECIRAVCRDLPQATVGVGTIMTPADATAAIESGARFGVSPGLTPELAGFIQTQGFPFLPGVATVSEAMTALSYGFDFLKFFPAEISGGSAFLKAVSAVLPNLSFCPTGGVGPGNARDYLALATVKAIGGSWMVKRGANGEIDLKATRLAATQCREIV